MTSLERVALLLLLALSAWCVVYKAEGQPDIETLAFAAIKDWADGEVINEDELDNLEQRDLFLLYATGFPKIPIYCDGAVVDSTSSTRDLSGCDEELPDFTGFLPDSTTLGLCIDLTFLPPSGFPVSNGNARNIVVGWRSGAANVPDTSAEVGDYDNSWGFSSTYGYFEGAGPYSLSADILGASGHHCFHTGIADDSSALGTLSIFAYIKSLKVSGVSWSGTNSFKFLVTPFFSFNYAA